MANNQINTTTPGMQAAASKFEDTIGDFNGYLRTVNEQMVVLQSTWTGDASVAFSTAMDGWESNFQVVIKELAGMAEAMGINTKIYIQQEEDNSRIAQDFGQLQGF